MRSAMSIEKRLSIGCTPEGHKNSAMYFWFDTQTGDAYRIGQRTTVV